MARRDGTYAWCLKSGASLVVILALLLASAVRQAAASPGASSQPASASASVTLPSTPVGSTTSPLVGTWVGEHRCETIVDVLTAAGFATSIPQTVVGNGLIPGITSPEEIDPANPCAGAVVREHAHVFTDEGEFQSLDWDGAQVDDGQYFVESADVLSINGTTFRFALNGDALTLEPFNKDQWATMVALPGTTWRRAP